MPRIWDATVSGHRDAVRNAILDGTAKEIHRVGVASLSMSDVAQAAGISRATLYKYFPDLDAVLEAWHHRMVHSHLAALETVSREHDDAAERLHAVLREYAILRANRPDGQIAISLHDAPHMGGASVELRAVFTSVLNDAADAGGVTRQIPIAEAAIYCEYALSAAVELPSRDAIDRLVELVIASLAPPGSAPSEPKR
ncbi:TetR/AcrR family transcriptional regulator [Micromonospora sp. DT81.3]|uniref:TetR/AcrR family transcriptional regulator n=1 Tax=Micromonospora sp. DT81.3 TaxID=3416523 RepID=UPI003CE683F7